MKREGILDDIEKIVDDAWDIEKKEINTHVDSEKNKMDMWYDDAVARQMKVHHDEYKREYLQELEKRSMWDSTYSSAYGGNPRTSPSALRHKCGQCGVNIKVVYIEERIDFNSYTAYGRSDRIPVMERVEHDHFYCPRCREQINVIGKVIELTVNMTE